MHELLNIEDLNNITQGMSQEEKVQYMKYIYDIQKYQYTPTKAPPNPPSTGVIKYHNPMTQQLTPVGMIAMRMHWPSNGDRAPFDFIEAFRTSGNKYFVFVVHNEQAVTLEDNDLFPSDTLITQLRLMLKE